MENETCIAEAKRLRFKHYGRDVHLRGIIEFSNYCKQNCLYCGLRRDNLTLPRYRLSPEEILSIAKDIREMGISTVVLQSGEDLAYSTSDVARIIEHVKELGLVVTLSLGERPREDYAIWKRAGADRYLLKMETFDEARHVELRAGASLADRLRALYHLIELGYEYGSGIIGGLPNETPETLAYDMSELAKLDLKMISVSPFVPHPNTPLGGVPSYGVDETLRLMAIARVDTPAAHIPVTSALSLYGDEVRLRGLEIGDVLMFSFTPTAVRGNYAIYAGKNAEQILPEERARRLMDMLRNADMRLR